MARPKATFSITYEVITEESAANGDHAEHGWWTPGGWEYPLGADGTTEARETTEADRQARIAEARAGEFDLSLRDAIRAARDLGCSEFEAQPNCGSLGGCFSCRSVDPPNDRAYFEQGESRYYCLHGDHLSPGSIRRIARLLGVEDTNGWRYPEYGYHWTPPNKPEPSDSGPVQCFCPTCGNPAGSICLHCAASHA